MKIKTPTEFLTFNDGLCTIYAVKNNQLAELKMKLCFGDQVVGMKRFYIARTATTEIHRLIHVPLQRSITPKDNVVIDGMRYKIEQIQNKFDMNPPVTVLTLHQIGVMS